MSQTDSLRQAHLASMRNRQQVMVSDRCGCFCCLTIFPPDAITEWTDEEETALCPHCSVDSVIGAASGFAPTAEFLCEMHARWFKEPPRKVSESSHT